MRDETRPSKSQKKRDVEALQKLGEQLLTLRESDLKNMPLSDKLREALQLGRSISAHGALRRHKQYIGKLMRDEDSASIAAAVEALKQPERANVARQHQAERWRGRLLEPGEAPLTEFLLAYPSVDETSLRGLISDAHSVDQNAAKRAKRELFRLILGALD